MVAAGKAGELLSFVQYPDACQVGCTTRLLMDTSGCVRDNARVVRRAVDGCAPQLLAVGISLWTRWTKPARQSHRDCSVIAAVGPHTHG
jgi:hypothetical protein